MIISYYRSELAISFNNKLISALIIEDALKSLLSIRFKLLLYNYLLLSSSINYKYLDRS